MIDGVLAGKLKLAMSSSKAFASYPSTIVTISQVIGGQYGSLDWKKFVRFTEVVSAFGIISRV